MWVDLAFGKSGLRLELPEGFRYRVLEARTAPSLADATAAIEAALDAPIASAPLAELARGKRSAAISVCDITRPAPNRTTLPPVLRRLEQAGIPREGITILIATGLHRPASAEEIRQIVGEDVARAYRIVNHDARDPNQHRRLGRTQSGTPVAIDERFLAADLHVTLGFIEPHLMLGFSGGRKLIVPGLASQETIKTIHSPRFMREPKAVEGSLDDNPLHRELLEIAAMARHDFILDVALARDRTITGVFAGNSVVAHKQGAAFVGNIMLQQLDQLADAAITTAAGYPLDLTFYQAIKGLTAASHVVKPGGRILLAAACEEGSGGPEFSRMLEESCSDAEFMRQIATNPDVVVDQWQLEKFGLVTARAKVSLYVPGLAPRYRKRLWGAAYETPQAAIQALLEGLPQGASVAVMPDGPYILARAAAGA
jgi:nickel-dependent lactate racemase